MSTGTHARGRSRFLYAVLAASVIAIGLFWRSPFAGFPPFVTKYGGSAWWSLLVFLCCGFLFARARTSLVTLVALLLSFGVEFSQLYHAPWIDEIREVPLGTLILGNTYSSQDLVAYAAGIFVGAIAEAILRRRGSGSRSMIL